MIPLAALATVALLFAFREWQHAGEARAHAEQVASLVHAVMAKSPGDYTVMERAHKQPLNGAEPKETRRQTQVGAE